MEEGFESGSRSITQENEVGEDSRSERAYACNVLNLQQLILFSVNTS